MRYGPLDPDLRPQDQLRPLLPTWNPPPTRPPAPEELEVSTRLRFKLDDRWWAATVREVGEEQVKVGFDGWPSRHDQWVARDNERMYLHESSHPEYQAPPIPERYTKTTPTDAEGNPLPVTPRAPRPKVYDPEKERLKRALRPPLPYNPEKERLKRLLRGQHAPQMHDDRPARRAEAATAQESQSSSYGAQQASPVPAAATLAPDAVEWKEVPGGVEGRRGFRHTLTGELLRGKPPSGWAELIADGGQCYYWHVGRNVTQWERPQAE